MTFGERPKVGKEVNHATVCGKMSKAEDEPGWKLLIWEDTKGVWGTVKRPVGPSKPKRGSRR